MDKKRQQGTRRGRKGVEVGIERCRNGTRVAERGREGGGGKRKKVLLPRFEHVFVLLVFQPGYLIIMFMLIERLRAFF
jgi:hypothetical protein